MTVVCLTDMTIPLHKSFFSDEWMDVYDRLDDMRNKKIKQAYERMEKEEITAMKCRVTEQSFKIITRSLKSSGFQCTWFHTRSGELVAFCDQQLADYSEFRREVSGTLLELE